MRFVKQWKFYVIFEGKIASIRFLDNIRKYFPNIDHTHRMLGSKVHPKILKVNAENFCQNKLIKRILIIGHLNSEHESFITIFP